MPISRRISTTLLHRHFTWSTSATWSCRRKSNRGLPWTCESMRMYPAGQTDEHVTFPQARDKRTLQFGDWSHRKDKNCYLGCTLPGKPQSIPVMRGVGHFDGWAGSVRFCNHLIGEQISLLHSWKETRGGDWTSLATCAIQVGLVNSSGVTVVNLVVNRLPESHGRWMHIYFLVGMREDLRKRYRTNIKTGDGYSWWSFTHLLSMSG